MPDLLTAIVAFPTVVFTVMLALAILYWLFVVVGAVDIDAFGGADHAIEGAAGAAKGAMEGAVGAAKGAVEGMHDGLDVDGLDAGDPDGALAGLSNVLKLGSAPVTVVFSLFALFGWLFTALFVVTFGVPGALVGAGVLVGSAVVSLLLTSLAIRPLAPIFVTKTAKKSKDLVGKIATITTGHVTTRFGQASVADGGAGLSLQIRAEPGANLKRGDSVVLVYWDLEHEAFQVEKLPSGDELVLSQRSVMRVETITSDLDTDDPPNQEKKRGTP